jgi:hypothetical protein
VTDFSPRGPTTEYLRQLADTVAGIIGSSVVDIAPAQDRLTPSMPLPGAPEYRS